MSRFTTPRNVLAATSTSTSALLLASTVTGAPVWVWITVVILLAPQVVALLLEVSAAPSSA